MVPVSTKTNICKVNSSRAGQYHPLQGLLGRERMCPAGLVDRRGQTFVFLCFSTFAAAVAVLFSLSCVCVCERETNRQGVWREQEQVH